jgi:hypothetical protein
MEPEGSFTYSQEPAKPILNQMINPDPQIRFP